MLDDVTRLVEQERQIFADRQRFRAIFDNVRDYAIYTMDRDGLIDEWNQSLHRFGCWPAEDVVQQPLTIFCPEEERGADRIPVILMSARAAGSAEIEGWCIRRDGSRLWANTVITALPDVAGAVRGFVAVSQDMTDRKKMEDELRRLATTDALTGVFNRGSGQAALSETFRRSHPAGMRPGVLMLDIDHFKSINDRHGHNAGDIALCALVAACGEVLGEGAAVTPWGGEEFVVILPSTDEGTAMALAETLRAAIGKLRLPVSESEIGMTASFGVAVDRDCSPDDLLRRADAALYVAKRSGRNCIVPG